MTFVKTQSDLDRFMAKVMPEPNSGCWLWMGWVNTEGYGQFGASGRSMGAHRWGYIALAGAIPAGLQLDHKCRVRCCVNPAHLEPVTNQENARRGALFGTMGKANAAKTHCRHGHSLAGDGALVRRQKTGVRRRCVLCRQMQNIAYRSRLKALNSRQTKD